MAVMLMSGAGLLIKSLWQLQRVDPGFNASGVLKGRGVPAVPESRYPQDRATFPNWPAQQRLYAELQSRAAAPLPASRASRSPRRESARCRIHELHPRRGRASERGGLAGAVRSARR